MSGRRRGGEEGVGVFLPPPPSSFSFVCLFSARGRRGERRSGYPPPPSSSVLFYAEEEKKDLALSWERGGGGEALRENVCREERKRDTPEESALPYKEIKMFLNFFFLFPQTPWTPSWPCSWPTPSTSRTLGPRPSRTSRRKRTWWIKPPKYKHFPAYC